MANSTVLLDDTGGKFNVTGDAFRADGWFSSYGGKYTASVHYHNLKGRIVIEASLASDPKEDDWFPIWLTSRTPYVELPKDMGNPTGSIGSPGDTGVEAFTFDGNFTWLRARLDRSYIYPEPKDHMEIAAYGVISKILLKG